MKAPALHPAPQPRPAEGQAVRLRLTVRGAVQGVGFRPYAHRLARSLGLRGWVRNTAGGAELQAEGVRKDLDALLDALPRGLPAPGRIASMEPSWLDPVGLADFAIHESATGRAGPSTILPDLAPCAECVAELFDPANRRHRHAFISCTHCGPRFTILRALPYDRSRTAMERFPMCARCRAEYDDPRDRRFHAQTIACPHCGPRLALRGSDGRTVAEDSAALAAAGASLRAGAVLAVKGIGGFQLMVDATNPDAVALLRRRKHREEKPFALMARDLDAVRAHCRVSDVESRLLQGYEAPIVLLPRASACPLPSALAPGNSLLGMMLPSSPLHHLLLRELDGPVVATSGNRGDEPICIDEREALERLGDIADLFLVHDRPILRRNDDSIVRQIAGREILLRRARGYSSLPLPTPPALEPVRALGAQQKCTIALAVGDHTYLSQHIGDLASHPAVQALRAVREDLEGLLNTTPELTVGDLHPDYASTQLGRRLPGTFMAVQHHFAHVVACMTENQLEDEVLGVAWDGTGLGTDGTIWGGEFLAATRTGFRRVAHLRPFPLPGGDAAVREPWRVALALLAEAFGLAEAQRLPHPLFSRLTRQQTAGVAIMMARHVNCPVTSSAGRLFDGVASLLGLRDRCSFEGQAAMAVEHAATGAATARTYAMPLLPGEAVLLDWRPMIRQIVDDVEHGISSAEIAGAFHHALVEGLVNVAKHATIPRVVLTGGCFQNRRLAEEAIRRLREAGFDPYWHQRVPPNDGGLALGQAAIAVARRQAERSPVCA